MIAYAITDESTLNFQTLVTDLQRFVNKAKMIVYRDKLTSNYHHNAKLFLEKAQQFSFDKVLLHTNIALADVLQADGVHLTSMQFHEIQRAKRLGLFVVISTHTLEEAKEAEALGADMVTFSPIFSTPNKGEPKGLEMLKNVVSELSIPVIALGGIVTDAQVELCQESGAKGFASIRYFAE
ncbi:MAG: hypothetical protein KU29_09970 [Sulfurovum sp. FS06-10]|nr:MAG: hypothetical protein KU29_09970 [Sulfurovum sp. FS06-10]